MPFFRRTLRITRVQPDVARDVADEIALHIDLRTEELIEQGVAPAEARRQAEAAFGDRSEIERECRVIDRPWVRQRQRGEFWRAFLGDTQRAIRDLKRRPAFALTAFFTLAVCIALNAAVFGVLHAVVLKPLPYPEPDRLVTLFNHYPKVGHPRAGNTVPEYFERREAVTAFEEIALYQGRTRTVGEPGAVQRIRTLLVTPSFFRVVGIGPHLGRTFTEDAEQVARREAILDFGMWQEHFAGDPSVIGQSIRIEGVQHTVIGVMPEDFTLAGWRGQLWLPLTFTEAQKSDEGRFDPFYQMLARLRPEATIEQAKAQVDAWNESLIDRVPAGYGQLIEEAGGFNTRIVSFHEDLIHRVKPWLYLLCGGALFVLLIGGISWTHLFLVDAMGRQRELATRYMLGAGRLRLIHQRMAESLGLAIGGGSLGLLAGAASLQWVGDFESFQIPRLGEVGLAPGAALLILLLAMLAMGGSSAIATVAVQQRDLFAVLHAGSATPGRAPMRLRGALTAAQIAVACLLLIGAALMSISMFKLLAIDPGFESTGVLAGAVNLPVTRYENGTDLRRFHQAALADLQALPGVTEVALANQIPLDETGEQGLLFPEGAIRQRGDDLRSPFQNVVSPGFFSLLEIPRIAGREFDASDDANSPPVMIVSETLAELYWQGAEAALGQRIFLGVDPYVDLEPGEDATWHTVVGVVSDMIQDDLADDSSKGAFYLPLAQQPRRFSRLMVKVEGEPYDLLRTVRERIFGLDSELVLFWVTSLDDSLASSLIRFRVPMRLLTIFAIVALMLAAIGVYGVLAQSVSQRAREIGIRMALGGSLGQIRRGVLRSMLTFVTAGLLMGLGLAWGLTRWMADLLYDVHPTDPGVFLAAGAVIATIAWIAGLLPARRATRIDPVQVLASE